jgi:signal recognition particle subunit SRP54
MTKEEKAGPDMLAKSASRRRRLARGSGRSEQQVNELLSTFTGMRLQMKSMSRMMAASGGMGVSLFANYDAVAEISR